MFDFWDFFRFLLGLVWPYIFFLLCLTVRGVFLSVGRRLYVIGTDGIVKIGRLNIVCRSCV